MLGSPRLLYYGEAGVLRTGYLDLPVIWRGCSYPAVVLVWSDEKGQPLDLTGWAARAYTPRFSLNAGIITPTTGRTRIGPLTKTQTAQLRLGVDTWDWIWVLQSPPFTITRPMLRGKVVVKEAVTDPEEAP